MWILFRKSTWRYINHPLNEWKRGVEAEVKIIVLDFQWRVVNEEKDEYAWWNKGTKGCR